MSNLRKKFRVFYLLFIIGLIIFAIIWFVKNTSFCPKGTIPIGNRECRGTGVIPSK